MQVPFSLQETFLLSGNGLMTQRLQTHSQQAYSITNLEGFGRTKSFIAASQHV